MSFPRGFLLLGLLPAVAATAPAQQRWTLAEEIRIGSLDEGPAMFSDVRGFVVQRNGDVWVLDYKTQDIRIFDASGKFRKTVGRAGSGPGEMRTANGMLLAPDGRVWVNDPGNSRFSVFDSEGRHVANHVIPIQSFGFVWDAMIDTGGVLHEPAFFPAAGGEGTYALRRVSPAGAIIDTIPQLRCGRARPPEETTFMARSSSRGRYSQIPFVPRMISAWDPQGFFWCAESGEYDLVQLRLGSGDTARRITREAKPLPVSDGERDAEIERVREAFKDFPDAKLDFSRIPRVKPPLMGLHLDEQGLVWVRRTTADSTKSAFDVLDRAGRQIATVEAPFAPSRFLKPVIRGDRFYALVRDEDDVPYIVRARIVRPRGITAGRGETPAGRVLWLRHG